MVIALSDIRSAISQARDILRGIYIFVDQELWFKASSFLSELEAVLIGGDVRLQCHRCGDVPIVLELLNRNYFDYARND